MKQNSVIAPILARVLNANGYKRLTTDQAAAAAREAAIASAPDDMIDNVQAIVGNLSALNQLLEKFGLVHTDRDVPALIVDIRKSLNPS